VVFPTFDTHGKIFYTQRFGRGHIDLVIIAFCRVKINDINEFSDKNMYLIHKNIRSSGVINYNI